MMSVTLEGRIGDSPNMRPQKTIENKKPFMRFKMWVQDEGKAKVKGSDGIERRPSYAVQVILPSNTRGEHLFQWLAPGRRVLVEGQLSHSAKAVYDQQTKTWIAYPNPTVRTNNGRLHFLDINPMVQAARDTSLLIEKGILTEEQRETVMAIFKDHYTQVGPASQETEEDLPDEIDAAALAASL